MDEFITSTVSSVSTVGLPSLDIYDVEYLNGSSSAVSETDVFSIFTFYTTIVGTVYPDVIETIPGVIPFQWQYEQRVLVSNFADGSESRRLAWQFNRKTVLINYRYITKQQSNDLYTFYVRMEGSFNSFTFFFPNNHTYYKEYCGTYNGTSTSINLPSKLYSSGSFRELYRGSKYVDPDDYVLSIGGGPDGSDRLALKFEPAIGEKFFWSFFGRLKIRARFSESAIQIDDLKDRFSSLSIELVGLNAEFV